MASSYSDLGLELMATGENAGTWGDKTNANLNLIEQLTGGYLEVSIAGGAQTTALDIDNGALTGKAQNRVIKLTGSISGNQIVTFPVNTENFYFIDNSTTGSYTVQLKAASGSGATVTLATDDKRTHIIYLDGVATNTGVFDTGLGEGDVTLTGTQTLTNKTLTSPKIGTKIDDTNGNELINLTATSSAVNEFTIANAATGDGPILSSTGETNVDININPKGSGVLKSGSAAVKIAGKESIWVPALAMYPNSTSGCADLAQTELSNGPEIKTLDFDKDSDEFAQFAVAFPKSWNEGTVTFQAFFTADTTNTGTTAWGLSGVAIADDDSINTAFGTQVVATAKAMSGTANDLAVANESGAVTIAGSPSTDEQVFFQISRDVSADSLTADAKLLGIKLFFTTDAANDA
tara:strand:- start:296 stop:1513 length:1218 start_codon:yes stop_codon:yes gene_type:complete